MSDQMSDRRRCSGSVVDKTAANELRALQACPQLEDWGIYGATPAYDPAEGGYTGDVAVDPDQLVYALNAAKRGRTVMTAL
jgi:hypothetical protein